jgi:hypothetical protein
VLPMLVVSYFSLLYLLRRKFNTLIVVRMFHTSRYLAPIFKVRTHKHIRHCLITQCMSVIVSICFHDPQCRLKVPNGDVYLFGLLDKMGVP